MAESEKSCNFATELQDNILTHKYSYIMKLMVAFILLLCHIQIMA